LRLPPFGLVGARSIPHGWFFTHAPDSRFCGLVLRFPAVRLVATPVPHSSTCLRLPHTLRCVYLPHTKHYSSSVRSFWFTFAFHFSLVRFNWFACLVHSGFPIVPVCCVLGFTLRTTYLLHCTYPHLHVCMATPGFYLVRSPVPATTGSLRCLFLPHMPPPTRLVLILKHPYCTAFLVRFFGFGLRLDSSSFYAFAVVVWFTSWFTHRFSYSPFFQPSPPPRLVYFASHEQLFDSVPLVHWFFAGSKLPDCLF